MNKKLVFQVFWALAAVLAVGAPPLSAEIIVQCPAGPGVVCRHISAGDGYITLADGKVLYMFGFSDLAGVPNDQVMNEGGLAAHFPGPLLAFDEGDQVYLTLSNVGLWKRPDLFDPHTIHFHGHPNMASIFDGLPESGIGINTGASVTYYYQITDPGTYMYHCHVEALEHMQMGMLANLYVRPKQNKLPDGTILNGFTHHTGYKYAYNDGDGSTKYDVEAMFMLSGLDAYFHDEHENFQPLPFATMKDTYPTINGRGYPDTVNTATLGVPTRDGVIMNATPYNPAGVESQNVPARVQAQVNQKVLLRLSNLNVTRAYTFMSPSIPMQVVGRDAILQRGPTAKNMAWKANSVYLGSGETADVILDLTGVPAGTYFLHAAELNHLSNNTEDFGGMMTEIVVTP